MPPVTPSAMSMVISFRTVAAARARSIFSTCLVMTSCWATRRLLVLADRDARRRSGQELAGAGAGGHDESNELGSLLRSIIESLLLSSCTVVSECPVKRRAMACASPSIRVRRALGEHDAAQPFDGRRQLVVHDDEVVLAKRGDFASARPRGAAGWPPRCPCCGPAAAVPARRRTAASRKSSSPQSRAAGPAARPARRSPAPHRRRPASIRSVSLAQVP